jgi:hypothetical protein
LKAVASINKQSVAGVLAPQGVDHRSQRRKASTPLEDRSTLLPEELVVNIELRVDIGRVQDREVLCAARANGATLRYLRRIHAALKRPRQYGSGADTRRDASNLFDELAPRAAGPMSHRQRQANC